MYIDSHCHILDAEQSGQSIENLFGQMFLSTVKKAVIFGMPIQKVVQEDGQKYYHYDTHTDEYLASTYLSLSDQKKSLYAPLLCGFDPTDVNAIQYVEKMFTHYPFWRGIGEVLCRHGKLSERIVSTSGEFARMNHPALYPIYEFLAHKKLPILIHQNINNSDISSLLYADELIWTLENFPNTLFVRAHSGLSVNMKVPANYTDFLHAILSKYTNMICDISWVVYPKYVCSGGVVSSSWRELFITYPDRFMIGSDVTGDFDNLGNSMHSYDLLLNALPKDVALKIAYENADCIFF